MKQTVKLQHLYARTGSQHGIIRETRKFFYKLAYGDGTERRHVRKSGLGRACKQNGCRQRAIERNRVRSSRQRMARHRRRPHREPHTRYYWAAVGTLAQLSSARLASCAW